MQPSSGARCLIFGLTLRTSILHVCEQRCAGLPEPSLVAYVINTIISWAGSFRIIMVSTTDEPHHEKNLSSGFATRIDSNQPAQLMRLARVLKFHPLACRGIILSSQRTTKVLIRQAGFLMTWLRSNWIKAMNYWYILFTSCGTTLPIILSFP